MSDVAPKPPSGSAERPVRVLLTIVLAITVTGYFVGMRQSRQSSEQVAVYGKESSQQQNAGEISVAVAYKEQPAHKLGVNKDWKNDLAKLIQPEVAPPPKEVVPNAVLASHLAEREKVRAFDGAPPVIPHPTPPLGVTACMACHEKGLMIGTRRAPKMSHAFYANCTQCHVEVTKPDTKVFWENTFLALRPNPSERAFPGAPPPIPHPAWMRNDCQSCHGATGPAPLRTTHPERVSCLQCHALSDQLDGVPLASAAVVKVESIPVPPKEKK